jgi:hypothetical protein
VKRYKELHVIDAKDSLDTLHGVDKHTPIGIQGTVKDAEKRKRILEHNGYMNTWHIV